MSSQLFNSTPLHISKVDSFEESITNWFEMVGLERKYWTFIGSIGKKEFSGDVDIAVLEKENRGLEFWKELIEKLGLDFKVVKGFNQISFGYPFEGQTIQVDLMLSQDLEWSKFIYYSPNLSTGESEFKGIYRNLLLSSLIITESRVEIDKYTCNQHILRLNEGLVAVTKSFINDFDEITKVSKIINEKFITNKSSEICKMYDLQEPILTFEQLWNQVIVRSKVEEIKERFEKFCKQSKLTIPNYGSIKTDA